VVFQTQVEELKMRRLMVLASLGMLLAPHAEAWAAPSYATPAARLSASPPVGGSVATQGGFGMVTGDFGSTAITSLPGSGGEGLLMNNGNGTSTLTVPNGPSETVATPR
jgi:hypothetical protein